MADGDAPRPLPPRDPRPLLVHWVIDAAVVFLLTVIVAIFLGAAIITVAIASVVAGVFLAPWTRSLEARGRAPPPQPAAPTPPTKPQKRRGGAAPRPRSLEARGLARRAERAADATTPESQ